jgi:hypothetical protein
MEKITAIKNIAADLYAYCRKYKEKIGKTIVDYTCSYTPKELIIIVRALPFRSFGIFPSYALSSRQ